MCWLKTKVSAFRHIGALSDHIVEAFQSLWCPKKVLPVSFSLLPSGRRTSKAMSRGTARLEWPSCKKHRLISHQLLSVLAGIS